MENRGQKRRFHVYEEHYQVPGENNIRSLSGHHMHPARNRTHVSATDTSVQAKILAPLQSRDAIIPDCMVERSFKRQKIVNFKTTLRNSTTTGTPLPGFEIHKAYAQQFDMSETDPSFIEAFPDISTKLKPPTEAPFLPLPPLSSLNWNVYKAQARKINPNNVDLLLSTSIKAEHYLINIHPYVTYLWKRILERGRGYWEIALNNKKVLQLEWIALLRVVPNLLQYTTPSVRTMFRKAWSFLTVQDSASHARKTSRSEVFSADGSTYQQAGAQAGNNTLSGGQPPTSADSNRQSPGQASVTQRQSTTAGPGSHLLNTSVNPYHATALPPTATAPTTTSAATAVPGVPPNLEPNYLNHSATAVIEPRLLATPGNRDAANPNATSPKKPKGVSHFAWSRGRVAMWMLRKPGQALPSQATTPHSHEVHSHCPPATVDIRMLGNHPVSAVELLTYFPAHTAWRQPILRLARKGWTGDKIVRFILWSRGVNDPKALNATTLAKQKTTASKWADGHFADAATLAAQIDRFELGGISDERALPNSDNRVLEDYRLADLADGVQHHPTGADRQLLTAAVELALHLNDDVRLSGYAQFVNNNWTELNHRLTPMGTNHDLDAFRRWDGAAQVKAHCNRIGYVRR